MAVIVRGALPHLNLQDSFLGRSQKRSSGVTSFCSIGAGSALWFDPPRRRAELCRSVEAVPARRIGELNPPIVHPPKTRKTRSRRFLEIQKLRGDKEYDLLSALSLMKQMSNTKFIGTAEAHFRLNINPKYNDQQLRATVILPKGTGKPVKVAVITEGENIDEAKNAGADLVGGEDLIGQIKGGFMDFDKLIASPEMMPKIVGAGLGKILGPRGLMPNPKAGTVTAEVAKAIGEFRKGKIEYRADKMGIVHLPFGRTNFSDDDLLTNLAALIRSVEANKPSGAKGRYWKSAYICSAMSPSVKLNIREMRNFKFQTDAQAQR